MSKFVLYAALYGMKWWAAPTERSTCKKIPEPPPPSEVASRAPRRVCRLFRTLRTPTSRLGL